MMARIWIPVLSLQRVLIRLSWGGIRIIKLQRTTELSPEEWVYKDFTTYVITHKERTSTEKIWFTDRDPVDLVRKLKAESGKNIWICGGANIVSQLVKEDLIDCYHMMLGSKGLLTPLIPDCSALCAPAILKNIQNPP